ncbi:50S ribosomal protein L5 [Candidatus Woesearchaeota archaeon]|nr:large subunit ribosomal protein L5 [uncultured archaeon]KHO47200.1 MAG: large subunit ribosomal protein L5 [archaeon GW2011_AR4]MBS3129179.1 50S ribosomal protein L5 [Candidatus Woesearchaeota archaeon]HIH37912.1 50S ribosomal protein L5 [Candidatus Woesearchaeota archaeon]HIH48879.1 50S ribosomal protein L5 [Candidatus Woesearchaeota archaeon]
MNKMKTIRVEKVTLNFGAGKDQALLEKGVKLIKHVTGISPVKTITQKRIQEWGLRPGLPIGCKLTLRGPRAIEVLGQLLESKEKILKERQFDTMGNLSFGIPEYIDIPNVRYDPDLGIMGFEVSVTLTRPGYRVKSRRNLRRPLGKGHKITKQEAIEFMTAQFGVKVDV